MTRAICFDLDGTLFDDRQYIRGGLRHAGRVLADETGVDLTAELLAAYFEDGITDSTFDAVLEAHGLSTDLVPTLIDAYHDNDAALSPYPGAVSTLETLEDAYRLGVITGGTNGRAKLRRLGLEEFFEAVYVGPTFGTTKHDPEIFEAALETLGVEPAEAMYVGDRPSLDFPQPNQLGMTTVRVTTGRYADRPVSGDNAADHCITGLQALPAVLEIIHQ